MFLYVRATGDRSILSETVDGQPLRQRLECVLQFVLQRRWSAQYGLAWGATTIDWGDIAPEDRIGAVVNKSTHRAIDIYDNAMLLIAIDDFAQLTADEPQTVREWRRVEADLRDSIRRNLWDARRGKFVPHIYLDGAPFPADFDEASIWYHGGTTVAIEAGLLSKDEIAATLHVFRQNMKSAGAITLGLTNYPVYPKGLFQDPHVDPWVYQNGGDWDWFGARTVRALLANGFADDAYAELVPVVKRVERHDGFFEWYDMQDRPQGSATFRGSAGQDATAIIELQAWARAVLK